MSASLSTRGFLHKRKNSAEEAGIQRRRPSAASGLQSVDHFTKDVSDAQSREVGGAIDEPPVNRGLGDGDVESREAGGGCNLDIPISSVIRGDGVVQNEEVPSMSFFQGSSNFTINNSDFNQIHGNATIIRFGGEHVITYHARANKVTQCLDGQFTEAQKNLICDHIANLVILPEINDNLKRTNLTQSIINLPRAEAVFDDYQTKKKSGPCFEGTRVTLLREMADWATGTDESRMYVLSGLAGIGKSTVAYTIASRVADLNLLGASFFFSRDEDDRKNAKKFFTTIAYQLCVYNETFAKAIGDVLQTKRGSAAITKSPQEQLQALIVDPLRSIVQSRARSILVVVDALDECDQEDRLSVLKGLRQLVRTLSSFKVILTTRPHPYLDRFFSSQNGHKIFHLQDIENKVVDGDIRLYLNHSLSLKQIEEHLLIRQWCASDEEIDSLVRMAGRLFIIAATSVRFILDNVASNPTAQMQKLLHIFAQDRTPFKDLNEFYTIILRNVVPVDCDGDIVDRYQSVVGAIIFIHHPLHVTTLAHLIDLDVEEVRAVLVNLQSVILLGDDDVPHIYHKSFPDYITDSKRCKDDNLRIDSTICHTRMTIRCFQIMEQCLKYNILDLGTPARFMSNDDGLKEDGITEERLERIVLPQLQYACIYWANHLEDANIGDANVMKELEQFAGQHMLHWFEALSLIKKFDSAHRAIRVVLKVLRPTSSDLRQLLLDGLRFISKFYATIKRSALHTYYSALPFTPTESLLYHRYIKEAVHSAYGIDGGPKKWDALVANLSHGEDVNVVRFSLDSTMFVSWSMQMLKVWDATTGTPISTISGGGFGGGFAIANDFSTVALFEGNVITLYDVTGSEQGATFKTQAKISTVTISSEIGRIAAILSDQTLLLWDSGNGELIGSFDEFASGYLDQDWGLERDKDRVHLEFSPTGDRLAYSSTSRGFVRLRNGIDGRFVAYLDCESPLDQALVCSKIGPDRVSLLHCVAFSADGSRIATLSASCLKLWNCEDGTPLGIAWKASYRPVISFHNKLAISANGCHIATGYGRDVTLWSGNSGTPLPLVEVLHLDLRVWPMTLSLAISLDDTLAITTDDGILLYNVKTRSFISKLSFIRSNALAISPDSTRLAAGNRNSTIYLWDIQGIEVSNPSSNIQARGLVTALALFHDCSRVVCGFEYGAVELRETGILAKRPIAARTRHPEKVTTLGCSPHGRRFASVSGDGTINLWDGESGMLRGALRYPTKLGWLYALGVEISNTVLAVAGEKGIFLWDLETLDHIHTFNGSFERRLSFSANGALLAAVLDATLDDDNASEEIATHCCTAPHQTVVFDVTMCKVTSTFNIYSHAMAFLPDNSHLVVQHFDDDIDSDNHDDGDILTFNLVNKKLVRGSTFEHFVQLCNLPRWLGVPVSITYEDRQWCLGALFSQRDRRVPVLWIPRELDVRMTAEGRSMIALVSENGHIIFLRLY